MLLEIELIIIIIIFNNNNSKGSKNTTQRIDDNCYLNYIARGIGMVN